MDRRQILLQQAQLLIQRLERISADSLWARRASGNRGALLHCLEVLEAHEISGSSQPDNLPPEQEEAELNRLQLLISAGFEILENAAKERLR